MGVYDSVVVTCPKCGMEHEFQSKSGRCTLSVYSLDECPEDVLANVNRHSPYECSCGVLLEVDIEQRKAIIVKREE